MSKIYHNRSIKALIPPYFTTQNPDMCHGTIGIGLVEIEVPYSYEVMIVNI
jgi:hypothetical protein